MKPGGSGSRPWLTNRIATTNDSGNMMRNTVRARPTQKLPSVLPVCGQTSDQGRLHAHAGDAEMSSCTGCAHHSAKWLIVAFRRQDCQLVLVMKLTAALKATWSVTAGLSVLIERQHALKPRDPIQQQEGHVTPERKHGQGIGAHRCSLPGIDSGMGLVDHALDRPNTRSPGFLARRRRSGQVAAQRWRGEQQHRDQRRELQPTQPDIVNRKQQRRE